MFVLVLISGTGSDCDWDMVDFSDSVETLGFSWFPQAQLEYQGILMCMTASR